MDRNILQLAYLFFGKFFLTLFCLWLPNHSENTIRFKYLHLQIDNKESKCVILTFLREPKSLINFYWKGAVPFPINRTDYN